jgi:hypothetical protein
VACLLHIGTTHAPYVLRRTLSASVCSLELELADLQTQLSAAKKKHAGLATATVPKVPTPIGSYPGLRFTRLVSLQANEAAKTASAPAPAPAASHPVAAPAAANSAKAAEDSKVIAEDYAKTRKPKSSIFSCLCFRKKNEAS